MELYGYDSGLRLDDAAAARWLEEVSIATRNAGELRRLASFFLHTADLIDAQGDAFDHEHYRDWWDEWQEGQSDLVIVDAPNRVEALHPRFEDRLPPLVRAAAVDDLTTVRELLANGSSPNECDRDGWSALSAAATRGHARVVAALLGAGAAVDGPDEGDGLAPLIAAAASTPNPETLDLLLAAGANPNVVANNTTPLDQAARGCQPEIAERLLEAGADAQWRDEHGFTILMTAAEAGCGSVVRLLLAAGVDPSLTCEGKTASDWARARGHELVADLLRPGAAQH